MSYVPVIDVSRWQGAINFALMRSRGVAGVIVRAGNGLRWDDKFDVNAEAAKAAGLAVGAYWFCNPKASEPDPQAELLAIGHNRHELTLPPMLDVENYEGEPGTRPAIYGAQYAVWLRRFCEVVEANSRRPFFYTNASYWNPKVGDATFGGYGLLEARYPFYSPTACAAHVPPVDANLWASWIMSATSERPVLPVGWDAWDGWQFSAGYNARAHTYGCSSADVDLNIVKTETWNAWLAKPSEEEMPSSTLPVITNKDQLFDTPPLVGKFALMDDGTIRHFTEIEWKTRGSDQGTPWSNADIAAAGVYQPPAAPVAPTFTFPPIVFPKYSGQITSVPGPFELHAS